MLALRARNTFPVVEDRLSVELGRGVKGNRTVVLSDGSESLVFNSNITTMIREKMKVLRRSS
jgi:hypothetical protein